MINTHKLPTILQSRENGSKDAVWRKAFWFIKANNHYKGKCGNTLVYTTNRCHKSQWWAGSGRSFSLPELKSKLLSCSLYTFLQSTLSSRIFRCSGNRTARSMQLKKTILWTAVKKKKKHFICSVPRRAGVLGVREIPNCASPKVKCSSDNASTLQATVFILAGPSIFLWKGHRFLLPWKLRALLIKPRRVGAMESQPKVWHRYPENSC